MMNSYSEQIYFETNPSQTEFFKRTKLFRNEEIALQIEFPQKCISSEKIINLINYSNFFYKKILLHFRCTADGADYLAEVMPEPAASEEFDCRFPYAFSHEDLSAFDVRNILISKDNSIIIAPAVMKKTSGNMVSLRIKGDGVLIRQRMMQRYSCQDTVVEIRLDQSIGYGELIDFNALFLKVRLRPESNAHLSELNLDSEVQITIRINNFIYFSGFYRIFKVYGSHPMRDLVFSYMNHSEPVLGRVTRIRNPRLKLSPSPTITFDHPFLKDSFEREVADLSNNGLLICEEMEDSVLIPGMIIPESVIRFAGILEVRCKVQILYRREHEKFFLYGAAIIDMNIHDHTLLTRLTFNHIDPHAFISKKINLEALWEFFFDTGFIYPHKYQLIGAARHNFKNTYKRLYEDCPEIARHFTYEKNGRIYGHISMVKAYSRAWLFHHLAARTMDNKIVGLEPLKQVIHFLDGFQELPSVRSDYIIAFYQPLNFFSERLFGDFTEQMANKRISSQDLFAYVTYPVERQGILPPLYSVRESTNADLACLESFYNGVSGGLLLEAMGIPQRSMIDYALQNLYIRSGFKRDCRIYSLTYRESPIAILIHDQSDTGLNLSEMLNSIKIFVMDNDTQWDILASAISLVAKAVDIQEIPIFVYPKEYVHLIQLQSKEYQFWILNIKEYDYKYKEYMARKFRIRYEQSEK